MGGLFGSAVLDVALGLIFIYLLLSIICTAANEWIAGVSKSRANLLRYSIEQLLGRQPAATPDASPPPGEARDFLGQFYQHPLMKGMMREHRHPAYISARVFAKVVMDLVTPHKKGQLAFADFERGVQNMPEGDVRTALLALVEDADADIEGVRRAIEGWFEDKMDRASGWYKRRTQIWTLAVAVCLTAASNADTLRMIRRLWTNPEMRAAFVEESKARAQQPLPSVSVEYPDPENPDNPVVTELGNAAAVSERQRALLGQVLGWQSDAPDEPENIWWRWLQRLLGWLLTVLAVSLGAPFWFDLLNKFVHIRTAGKSPDETPKRPEKKKLPPEDKTA